MLKIIEDIVENKAALRQAIKQQTHDFLAAGGKIQVVGSAVYQRELKLSRIERIEFMKAKIDREIFGGHGMGMGK